MWSDGLCTTKDLRTERGVENHGGWKSGNDVGKIKMKTGSMVRCSTLKEAELIPDSAVPYTLPESRWNSSNRQTSNGWEGGSALTHLTTCMRQRADKKKIKKKRPKKSGSVREGEPQLVSQREELAAHMFVCVLKCVWVCVRWVSSLQTAWREGRKRASGSECSERSQRIGWSTVTEQSHRTAESVRSHTHTQVWHAVRKQSIAQFACLCLSVYTQVCVCVCVHLWTHCGPFILSSPLNLNWNVSVWVFVLAESGTVKDGGINKIKVNE